MKILKWEDLPGKMKLPEVRKYHELLFKKKKSLMLKRTFDVGMSAAMIIIFSPLMAATAVAIKVDSRGPAFFRQKRVTQYGREFRIYKFRTMVDNADKMGSSITGANDSRITSVGRKIRKLRIDEIPQLFNIFTGEMTFVGTRPEVPKYVEKYSDEMMATLLLPAGLTSVASIEFRDEDKILAEENGDRDRLYVDVVLPQKMEYNLECLKAFSFMRDVGIMFRTAGAVFGGRNK